MDCFNFRSVFSQNEILRGNNDFSNHNSISPLSEHTLGKKVLDLQNGSEFYPVMSRKSSKSSGITSLGSWSDVFESEGENNLRFSPSQLSFQPKQQSPRLSPSYASIGEGYNVTVPASQQRLHNPALLQQRQLHQPQTLQQQQQLSLDRFSPVQNSNNYVNAYRGPAVNNQENPNVYVVAFKNTQKDYILGIRVPATIKINDAVIVAVDRGEDLGIVTRIMTMDEFIAERFHGSFVPNFNINRYTGFILRLATTRECRMLNMKSYDENEALEYARHLAQNVYRLNFIIRDVEYQFDRHKITIYFEAKSRVDYREFVQDIYSTYKARVWMERVGFK